MCPDATTIDKASGAGFQPLAPLLHSTPPTSLDAARRRLADLDRHELIKLFGKAFTSGKRLMALLAGDELTVRGIPPAFRHSHHSDTTYSLDQRFDLLLTDLRWLRRWYPQHPKNIRYRRYRDLFTVSEPAFHRAAEFVFYGGQRPAWKIVASMSLNEQQQRDSAWLRSAPIKKHSAATQAMHDYVLAALQRDLQNARRTKSFTDDDANVTLMRRLALWICSRMTDGSPTETAIRYAQMTGQEITRQAAAKQLNKVREILRKNEATL
jgi:hypothetical protein